MVGAVREAWPHSIKSIRTKPTTKRRYSKAFKLGIYTVDEKVPQ